MSLGLMAFFVANDAWFFVFVGIGTFGFLALGHLLAR